MDFAAVSARDNVIDGQRIRRISNLRAAVLAAMACTIGDLTTKGSRDMLVRHVGGTECPVGSLDRTVSHRAA